MKHGDWPLKEEKCCKRRHSENVADAAGLTAEKEICHILKNVIGRLIQEITKDCLAFNI